MSIVLIAPDGVVSKFWFTDWTWTELMESLQHTAHATAHRGSNGS
jgi:hypothetical protein